ncbi:MAG: hypothetical protein WD042_06165 [Phycisphaeraceae bacterium]
MNVWRWRWVLNLPNWFLPFYERALGAMAHHKDKEILDRLFPAIREYQKLASTHGIGDVFQDNGGKLLQTLLILNLRATGSREGNDAVADEGNEYELKTVNIVLTSSFSTHHHLNPIIIDKYRKVKAWYFSIYRGIELMEIYHMEIRELDVYFSKWERKWRESKRDINNPKIPVKFVRERGKLVFENPAPGEGGITKR